MAAGTKSDEIIARPAEEFVWPCVCISMSEISRGSENGVGCQEECGSLLCASAGLEEITRLNAGIKKGGHIVCSKSIARLEEIPERHIWITELIAHAIARSDRKNSGNSSANQSESCDGDLLHHDYLTRAYHILQNTKRLEELALMEKLVQGRSTKPKKKMTLDEIDAWIADHELKRLTIYQQLVFWDNNGRPSQASDWANRARKALAATERQIRFGYKLRLLLTRDQQCNLDFCAKCMRICHE